MSPTIVQDIFRPDLRPACVTGQRPRFWSRGKAFHAALAQRA
jgi:hypothetical protein